MGHRRSEITQLPSSFKSFENGVTMLSTEELNFFMRIIDKKADVQSMMKLQPK